LTAGAATLTPSSTDGTFAANSDDLVPTQKAAKTYVDGKATDAGIATTDVTTNNASTSKHGFLKKLSNVATEFMNGVGNWVSVTIDSLLPTQTGNSGKFLTTNGSASSWGAVTGFPEYTAGTLIEASAPTDRTTTSDTYAKIKEFAPVLRSGTVTVFFTASAAGGYQPKARIYVNGVAVGTERDATTSYSENIAVVSGDIIQIYGKILSSQTLTISDFQIRCANPTVPYEASGY
jgi:hypothetical protein